MYRISRPRGLASSYRPGMNRKTRVLQTQVPASNYSTNTAWVRLRRGVYRYRAIGPMAGGLHPASGSFPAAERSAALRLSTSSPTLGEVSPHERTGARHGCETHDEPSRDSAIPRAGPHPRETYRCQARVRSRDQRVTDSLRPVERTLGADAPEHEGRGESARVVPVPGTATQRMTKGLATQRSPVRGRIPGVVPVPGTGTQL
jgi:hypothetical protein